MLASHVTGEAFGVRLAPLVPELGRDFARSTSLLDFRYYSVRPDPLDAEGWADFIRARNQPDAYGFASFGHAVYVGDELAGMSTVFDVQPANRKCEVGFTMLFGKWRGSGLNAASKYLLMRSLFEDQGFSRVQLKGDARNTPSMRAMLNMGFSLEGTLRSFQILEGDYRRDVTMYSVVSQEWPKVKDHLTEMVRLRGLRPRAQHPGETR